MSQVDLRDVAMFVNGGMLRSIHTNPVLKIAAGIKTDLQNFIDDHKYHQPQIGFQAPPAEAVDVAPLEGRLGAAAEQLDEIISARTARAHTSLEIRALAVSLQATLEHFSLKLLSDGGDIALRDLPEVLHSAIDLKAEVNVLLLNLEAAQHKVIEACRGEA